MVFMVSLVIGAVAGGMVSTLADSNDVERDLRSIGMPTTTDQITDVALVGIIVSLAAVLVGAVLGGHLGERWHTKLARRWRIPRSAPRPRSGPFSTRSKPSARPHHQDDAFDQDLRDQTSTAATASIGEGRRGSLHRGGVAGPRGRPPRSRRPTMT